MNLSFTSNMKNLSVCSLLILLFACNNTSNTPDVSKININLRIQRFENDFFAIDSNNTRTGLVQLEKKYPQFLPLFINHVLGLGPLNDSNQLAFEGGKRFLHLNNPVYEKSKELYSNFSNITDELTNGFRYLKYYYPNYEVPVVITTIGPMDALAPMSNNEPSPNFMGNDFLAIGLQFYLGQDFFIYNDPGL